MRSVDTWVATRSSVDEEFGNPVHLPPTVECLPRYLGNGHVSRRFGIVLHAWTRNKSADMWEVPLLPFESVSLDGSGATYQQDFDQALGDDGKLRNVVLPTGWTSTDNSVIFREFNQQVISSWIVSRKSGTPDLQRRRRPDLRWALAMGVTGHSDGGMLQLLADVTRQDATSVQLKFDMEVWDAAKRNADLPGEAALHVTMEIDTGSGFAPLLDLGTVSTGEGLLPPAGDYLNGNAGSNRVAFDSGQADANIPAGSTLRIRWAPNLDVQSKGWVYGLDNVQLSVFGDPTEVQLRAGDADQDLDFDQLDLVQVQMAAKYLTGEAATWGEGDWDGRPADRPATLRPVMASSISSISSPPNRERHI